MTWQVDCMVTTAGGVEEDFMKCMAPFYMGDFGLDGGLLKERRLYRTGNLLVPNANYNAFEAWLLLILDDMLEEQIKKVRVWYSVSDCVRVTRTEAIQIGEK